jgi:hypothetical protein
LNKEVVNKLTKTLRWLASEITVLFIVNIMGARKILSGSWMT